MPRGKANPVTDALKGVAATVAAVAGIVCTGFQLVSPQEQAAIKAQIVRETQPLVEQLAPRHDWEEAPPWLHVGQQAAWRCEEEVVLILAGRQSGKTTIGPYWLAREIFRRGPGDYAFNGPTLELLKKKALPEFLRFFTKTHKLGTYSKSDRCFTFSEAGLMAMYGTLDKGELYLRYALKDENGIVVDDLDLFEVQVSIYVGYATKPESLESATYKAVWSDESGQPDFKLESNEALQGRRSVNKARHLHTTTPYDLGWQKTKIYDPCEAGFVYDDDPEWIVGRTDDMAVVRFESWMNPKFGRKQFDKIRDSGLAAWKFDLFYRAIYTRPAGQVYDVFDESLHVFKGRIPPTWPRAIGNDFGTRNMAAIKVAVDPKSDPKKPTVYVYSVYAPAGGKSEEEHVASILLREDHVPPAVGGAASEDGWREGFGANGLPIARPSVVGLDAQIQMVYAMFKLGRLKIAANLTRLIRELKEFSYQLDETGEPIPGKFRDENKYHRLACLRYVVSEIVHNPLFVLGYEDDATDLGYADDEGMEDDHAEE